jgi:hypothetical protein
VLDIPFLEGQPEWVIIVVVFLVIAGGVGGRYLQRKAGEEPETPPEVESAPDTVALPAGSGSAVEALREAMAHLAGVATREAQSADEAEEEVRTLRTALEECTRARDSMEREMADLRQRLTVSETRAHLLAQDRIRDDR